MDVERSERLCSLLEAAGELAAEARAAFLAQACGADEALRVEASSLLDHADGAREFLEKPAYAMAGMHLADPDAGELRPGDRLGDYEVRALVGEGGMSEVYLAEDARLERRVALKWLKRRLGDENSSRDFRHERGVLAALTHPNIARLYDGAMTPERRAYLVMEYVEGERLDDYCTARNLSVPARLALFRKVCAAVAYAHQNLVIHRDLKPANIRVTAEGEPKLLDFGIAKLLDPEGTLPGAEATMTMQAMMTPEYASPEQLRGGPITTASDVYSLGVILYELLTGQRPYRIVGRRPDQLAQAICEEAPPRPSTLVGHRGATTDTARAFGGQSSHGLRRLLEGDLDNIVAMAMRKEPGRRYTSVAQLSDDLYRHCEGLPVLARKDTLGYRTGKFVRRNKAAVIAGVLVTLALVGGLVATALEARRADRRFEDVRQLAHSILFEVEPRMANVPGNIPARELLVKRTLAYLDSLSREAGSRRDLRRELATAYEKVGDVQGEPNQPNLGDYKGALASYLKARDLRQALAAVDQRDPRAVDALAACDEHIGTILWWNNQTAGAQQSLEAALALRRPLVAAQPRSVPFRRGSASVLKRLGDIPSWNNRSAEALTLYQQATAILQPLARECPQDAQIQLDLAHCLNEAANTQKDSGDYPGAMKTLATARGVITPLARREPDNSTFQVSLWNILRSETDTLLARKAVDQALEICPEMLDLAKSLAGADPENIVIQHDLAVSQEADATALMQKQRWAEALAALQEALAIDAKFLADTEYQRSCGMYRVEMGRVRMHLGEFDLAGADARAAQDLLEVVVRLDPNNAIPFQDLVRAYELSGDLCEQRSEAGQARQWFQRALEIIRSRPSMDIAASDLDDWTALREKLTGKTASADTAAPPR